LVYIVIIVIGALQGIGTEDDSEVDGPPSEAD
jgi:hypothetical protein